jgi:hypothetical protein
MPFRQKTNVSLPYDNSTICIVPFGLDIAGHVSACKIRLEPIVIPPDAITQ